MTLADRITRENLQGTDTDTLRKIYNALLGILRSAWGWEKDWAEERRDIVQGNLAQRNWARKHWEKEDKS